MVGRLLLYIVEFYSPPLGLLFRQHCSPSSPEEVNQAEVMQAGLIQADMVQAEKKSYSLWSSGISML